MQVTIAWVKLTRTNQTNKHKTKLMIKADKMLNSFKMYIADKISGLTTEGTPYFLLFPMYLPGMYYWKTYKEKWATQNLPYHMLCAVSKSLITSS